MIDAYGDIYSEIEADEFAAQHPEAGLKRHGEYGPPSEKQRKYCTALIEEKISDDDGNKSMWYAEMDKVQDTWEMSILIDRIKKIGQ